MTIGAPCDGVVLYALFIFFILAFPGSVKHKLWFIPLGALSVFYLNVLRIVGLAIIMDINEEWLAFNHDYTFTIIVYASRKLNGFMGVEMKFLNRSMS